MHTLAFLGSIGGPELIVIFLIVLLLFGPKALPKLARSLGSSIREFKDATQKMTDTVMNEAEEDDRREAAGKSDRKPEIEGSVSRASSTASSKPEKAGTASQ